MKNSQATIRDIAIKLNISISTVSRSLRNAPDVNAETKKAVLEMAKVLNYEPNRVAQSLRSKRTNTLGVILPNIAMHFFSAAISGIQEYAAGYNYSTMFCQSMENYDTEKSNINMLVANRVDGLLISLSSQTENYDHLYRLIEKKIPLVLFDRVATDLPVSKVMVDDHDGAFKAVQHLIDTGCKRIAYIGGPSSMYISAQREKGYQDALIHANIPVREELIIHCNDLQRDPATAVQKLLDQREIPDAFFCINDPIALTTLQIIKERKFSIPDEISIVGFTNEPSSQYIEPSLTTVSQPAFDMGKTAAELFLDQVNATYDFEPVTKILLTELVIRNSTRKHK